MKQRRWPKHPVLLLVGLIVSAGCGSDPDDPNGPRVLEVRDFVLLTSSEGVPDVRDALPDGHGGTWVLSSFEPHVSLLDSVGEVTTRFGVSGRGPGELRNPWYLASHPEGIGVYDAGARRLKVFSPSGDLVAEYETPAPGGSVMNDYREANHGEPLRVHRFGAGWVFETYSDEVSNAGALWSGQLVYVREWDAPPDTLLKYQELRAEPYEAGLRLFAAAPLWTVCDADHIAVLNPLDSLVTRLGRGGAMESVKISLPLPPLTPELVEAWVDLRLDLALRAENLEVDAASRAMVRQQALGEAMSAAPDVQPPTKILCDNDGRLWVQGFSVETDPQGYGREWTVFEMGRLTASVLLPPRVWPLFVTERHIIAAWKDDLDVGHLVQLENPMEDDRGAGAPHRSGLPAPGERIPEADVDTVGAVVVVRNHAADRWVVGEPWRVREEFRLGAVAGDTATAFSNHNLSFAWTGEGSIAVLDYSADLVRLFTAEGVPIRTIGGPGQGPEEFGGPSGLVWDLEERLWVADLRNRRYSVFNSAGDLIQTTRRETSSASRVPFPLVSFGSLGIADERVSQGVRTFVLIDRDGVLVDTVHSHREPPFNPAFGAVGPVGRRADLAFLSANFIPRSRSAKLRPDGSLWTAQTTETWLSLLDSSGDTLRRVYLSRSNEPTEDDVERIRRGVTEGGIDVSVDWFKRPLIDQVHELDDGHILVGIVDEVGVPASRFDVLSPEGVFVGTLDFGFAMHHRSVPLFVGDTLLGVIDGELDVPYVVRATLIRSPPGPTPGRSGAIR